MEMIQNPLHTEAVLVKQKEDILEEDRPVKEDRKQHMEERRAIILQEKKEKEQERSKKERNGIKYTEAYTKIIENLNVLIETYKDNPGVVNDITRIITDTTPKIEGGKNTKRQQKTKRRHNKNQNKKSNKKHR